MDADDDGAAARQDEAKQLAHAAKAPLDEQIADKSWKVRKQAYEHILAQLRSDSSSHSQLSQLARQAVTDSNQGALEVACDLVIVLTDVCESSELAGVASGLADSLVGNALNSRPGIVTRAREALLRLVEHGFAEDVIAATSKAYKHKTPKVAAAAANATLEALQQFGPAVISPTHIVPPLLKVFDAKDVKIRATAKDIVIELAKWLGTTKVRSTILPKMRDTQQAELEAYWAKNPQEACPTPARLTHAQRAAQGAAEPAPGAEDPSSEAAPAAPVVAAALPPVAAAIDLDMLADQPAVDITTKLPKDFFTQVDAAKWSDRKQALTALKDAAAQNRAEHNSLFDVVASLKKVIQKDNNAACVAEACACVAALAESARKGFASFAKGTFLTLCFDKLKDKSSAVVKQSLAALTAMHARCVALKDAAEAVAVALAAPNPQVKQHTLQWLQEAIPLEQAADIKRAHEALIPPVVGLASDAMPAVRDGAVVVLSAFARVGGGTAAISKYTAKLDERRTKQLEVCISIPDCMLLDDRGS